MVTTGRASVLCPRTFIFFRLRIRMKSLNAFETLPVSGVWQQLHHQQTARPSSEPHRSLPWLWSERGWRACHLLSWKGRFPWLQCQRYASGEQQRISWRVMEQEDSLALCCCRCWRVWRNCHWNALFPSCWCGKPCSCFAALEGNQSLGESWKGCLNWLGQTPYHYYQWELFKFISYQMRRKVKRAFKEGLTNLSITFHRNNFV